MKRIPEMILNLLYPRHCPGCGRILKNQRALLCPSCRQTVSPFTEDYCLRCGRPVEPEQEYCAECSRRARAFDAGRSVFLYDERWKTSIERYKYYGYREFADFYAEAMAYIFRSVRAEWRPDLIVPVPLHRKKERQRGFNQSWLLARKISRLTGIPAEKDLVVKNRATASQKKLSAPERKKNLRGAFSVRRRITGITALVIDDVYTTGSTVEEMAAALKAAGAAKVYFLTLCTANRPR